MTGFVKNFLIFLDYIKEVPLQRKPNIDKAKTTLDREPNIKLDEGIDLTLE